MHWARQWLEQASAMPEFRNANSMTLVTVGSDRQPSARILLCKEIVADPGYLVFYTNYQSRKGRELAANARAAAVFHWDTLGRQIRIEGLAVRSPAAESDAYFASRPWGSQLGAWGSDQSSEIISHQALVEQLRERAAGLGIALREDSLTLAADEPPPIERPPHWGGYRLWAHTVELWVEGTDRIHDRALWSRDLSPDGAHDCSAGAWRSTRLQP
jgi:pyridoxamine 5'-phosphate oxidase